MTSNEGRAAYNDTQGFGRDLYLVLCKMNNHERDVAAFFAQCKKERPAETAAVFDRHVVLTRDQLDFAREQELFAFAPEPALGANGEPSSPLDRELLMALVVTEDASATISRRQRRRQQRARERGEPIPTLTSSWE